MPRLLIITALLSGVFATGVGAQTLTPEQQMRENQRNLELQQTRDRATAEHQLRQSQALTNQAQQNALDLTAQGQPSLTNPGLQPVQPLPYASSSAARRAAAQLGGAPVGTGAPASAVTPDVVGGPLNLPGPTDPAVRDYAKPNEPAANQPASTTPVRQP
jgi:hypothetical protein